MGHRPNRASDCKKSRQHGSSFRTTKRL